MNEHMWQEDEGTFGVNYRSTGKNSLVRFVPIFLISLVVSCIMAMVLLLLEAKFYYYIFTPLLVSLPVFAAAYLLIHLGHCRNSIVAGIATLVILGLYYIGYWQLSYWANIGYQGPEAVRHVREIGGAPGLLGYFNYCCKTVGKNSTSMDAVFQYVFYLIELGIFLVGGFALGHHLAGRIFYENRKRWGSSKILRFRADALSSAVEAVEKQDWAALAALPRIPGKVHTTGAAYAPALEFRIEYLKKAPEEPMYVTLRGMNLGRYPEARAAGIKGMGGLVKHFFKQRFVPPESAFFLSRSFPELKLPIIPESALGLNAPPPAAPASGAPAGKSVEYSSGLHGIFQRAGLASVNISGPDFRQKAVEASQNILRQSGSLARVEEINASLCLPVEQEQRLEQKPILHKFLLFAIVLIIGEIALGAALLIFSESLKNSKWQIPALVLGLAMFLFVGITLLCFHPFIRSRLSRRLLLRQGSLFLIQHGIKTLLVQLEDAASFHIRRTQADDLCICLLDKPNHRLVLEGFNHRYVVRQQDVSSLKSLDIGLNFPMVELCYRIGEEELKMVLYQGGAIGYLPIRPIWARNPSITLEKKLRKAFGI